MWFQSFIGDVCGSKSNTRIIMGMPGGASLYSLSVAWVSSCEALAPKRVLCDSMALFCVLPSYFQASENSVNKGFKRSLCYFTRPFSCLNGKALG